MQTSSYHISKDNYFRKTALLRHLSAMGYAATGTVRTNRREYASLRDMVKMNKEKRGSSCMATVVSSNITTVHWKDDKVNNAISTFTGKQPYQQVKRYCHREKCWLNIEQRNITNQYKMFMGRVNYIDQNISTCMMNLRTNKWWCLLFSSCCWCGYQ